MQAPPRITVEVPVLSVGTGPADYESLGNVVEALRRPQGLHLTLLHIGILDDLAHDIEDWTKGVTSAGDAQIIRKKDGGFTVVNKIKQTGTDANPVVTPLETTTYYVTGIDSFGCWAIDSVIVTVVPGIEYPDGFTPNGDGINDVWVIDYITFFPGAKVSIYNRWGEELFNSTGYPVPWDGKYKGKDLPVGTYYYVIDLHNNMGPYTGPITIAR